MKFHAYFYVMSVVRLRKDHIQNGILRGRSVTYNFELPGNPTDEEIKAEMLEVAKRKSKHYFADIQFVRFDRVEALTIDEEHRLKAERESR